MLSVAFSIAGTFSACASRPAPSPTRNTDRARRQITDLLPSGVTDRAGWAADIETAFGALQVEPTASNQCAVVAVIEQESMFKADPPVAGLGRIARRELDTRAASHHVPQPMLKAALQLQSPTGETYAARLEHARTERDLSDLYEDFLGMVPLGNQLFGRYNPIRTAGPMQVSVSFAEAFAAAHRYPYPTSDSIRHELFTRRGGVYFGVAHLLVYPAAYESMLFRFADYNAGQYASRNAAFQHALAIASHRSLALDGDVLLPGTKDPSQTELAARAIATRLKLSDEEIRSDLERGRTAAFGDTRLYTQAFALAEGARGHPLSRAEVPQIRLQGPKLTRALTTAWYARRVDERYRDCLRAKR